MMRCDVKCGQTGWQQRNERADDDEDGFEGQDKIQFRFRSVQAETRAEIGGRRSQILIKSGTDATEKQSRERNPTALTSNYAVISRCASTGTGRMTLRRKNTSRVSTCSRCYLAAIILASSLASIYYCSHDRHLLVLLYPRVCVFHVLCARQLSVSAHFLPSGAPTGYHAVGSSRNPPILDAAAIGDRPSATRLLLALGCALLRNTQARAPCTYQNTAVRPPRSPDSPRFDIGC